MNREILFKAKRLDNGEWVEGYLFEFQPCQYMICDKKEYERSSTLPVLCFFRCCGYEIDPDTLCEYTGLTDKNGKKIWENDILKAHLDESYPEDITYTKILWNECRFCTNENYSMDIETLGKWDAEHFQVCGNIFDNPELLEVK